MKKKRKCNKGYSCGNSCINVKLICRKGLTGQSVNIVDRLANLLKAANQTNSISISSKYKGVPIDSLAHRGKNSGSWFLSFKVDDEFDVTLNPNLSRVDRIKIAAIVRRDMEKILNEIPDNSMLKQEPNNIDGKGARRASLYKRFGFGDIAEDGFQYAYKINGVITPIN